MTEETERPCKALATAYIHAVSCDKLLIKLFITGRTFNTIPSIDHYICCKKVEKYDQILCVNLVHFADPVTLLLIVI